MKRRAILAFIIVCTATAALARDLTLNSAIDMAQEKNRTLIQKNYTVEQKKLNQKSKVKAGLPTLNAESYYHDFQASTNNSSYFQSGIIMSQPIYQGGKIYYDAKSAKGEREKEEIGYYSDSLNLRLNVISAYVSCLQLEKVLEVYEVSYREKTEELKKQKEFYKLGLIDKSEILRIETSVYQSETSIAQAKKQIELQKLQLKNLLGMDLEEDIALKDVNIDAIPIDNISLKNDIQRALKDGVTAQMLKKDMEIIKAQEKSSRSDLLPKINGEYGYESLKEGSFSRGQEKWQWRVGLSFTWKLFNFGSGLDTYRSAKLETKKVEVSSEDSIQTLKEQITSAYLDMKTYKETIRSNKKAMESAQETYNIDREKFSNRLIDSLDFLKTETELRDAQLTYINSQLDYYLSYERYLTLLK